MTPTNTDEERQRRETIDCPVKNKLTSIQATSLFIEQQREHLLRLWKGLKPVESTVTFKTIEGRNVAIKDESHRPTGTYKAIHGHTMVNHYLQHHYPEQHTYIGVSTGNAGYSDFAYAHALEELMLKQGIGRKKRGGEQEQGTLNIVNFFPRHHHEKLLGPDSMGRFTRGKKLAYAMREEYPTGIVETVDFDERYWSTEACREHLDNKGIHLTPENSTDITEGFNPTYTQVPEEFVQQIERKWKQNKGKEFPRTLLVVQYGAGMLHDDCKQYVQEQKLPIDVLAVSTHNPETIADKICDVTGRWQDHTETTGKTGTSTSRKTGDIIYHVTEQEILLALQRMRKLSISAEPSGAAGLAILPRLEDILGKERMNQYDLFAFINTGNGIMNRSHGDILDTIT